MYISYLYEAIYISHVLSLEKKGLECTHWGRSANLKKIKSENLRICDFQNLCSCGPPASVDFFNPIKIVSFCCVPA